jgi:hypothetical protein
MKVLRTKKEINEQYLKQDFHPYQKPNGQLILVSDDFKFCYYPKS